jgi:putative oxidoreductase
MDRSLISREDETAARRRDTGLLAPRAALAASMLYHGLDKLRHPQKAAASFAFIGVRPPTFWMRATAIAETSAGVLTALGVLVRPAALAVLVTQAVAIAKVHGPKGFPSQKGGYEFNLALMAIAAGLLLAGPGRFSASHLATRALPKRRGWPSLFRRRPRGVLATLLHALG